MTPLLQGRHVKKGGILITDTQENPFQAPVDNSESVSRVKRCRESCNKNTAKGLYSI